MLLWCIQVEGQVWGDLGSRWDSVSVETLGHRLQSTWGQACRIEDWGLRF